MPSSDCAFYGTAVLHMSLYSQVFVRWTLLSACDGLFAVLAQPYSVCDQKRALPQSSQHITRQHVPKDNSDHLSLCINMYARYIYIRVLYVYTCVLCTYAYVCMLYKYGSRLTSRNIP